MDLPLVEAIYEHSTSEGVSWYEAQLGMRILLRRIKLLQSEEISSGKLLKMIASIVVSHSTP